MEMSGPVSSAVPLFPRPIALLLRSEWEDVASMPILLIALFIAMVAVALWAWVVTPGERRFSVRVGAPPSFDGTLGKRTGLLVWVALGAAVMTGSLMAEADAEADNGALTVAGAALLVFLLLMEIVSVRRLMR
jgi:hypothetical protein